MPIYKKIIDCIKFNLNRVRFLAKVSILLPGFIAAHLSQIFKSLPENKKKMLFIMEDHKLWDGVGGNSRYIYLILKRFNDAGYNIYFYKNMSLRVYKKLGNDGKLIFKIKNLKIIKSLPSNTSDIICAFDTIDDSLLKKKWKSFVYINTFKPPFCQIGNLLWLPYFMYAKSYETCQDQLVDLYRSNDRKIKMIFAGNTSQTYYNNLKLKNNYGKLTRVEGVNTLLELDDKVRCGEGRKNFEKIMNIKGYANECRILLTNEKFPIKPNEWFKLLSTSDFFICLSGTDQPICHHTIESMAIGTIPIVGYPEWFFPSLEHKKNAIVYDGKEDLIKKFNEVLAMSTEEIIKMRKNVIDYYERHLSAESFIREFESQKGHIFTMMMHPRLVCKKETEAEGKELYSKLHKQFNDHCLHNYIHENNRNDFEKKNNVNNVKELKG